MFTDTAFENKTPSPHLLQDDYARPNQDPKGLHKYTQLQSFGVITDLAGVNRYLAKTTLNKIHLTWDLI